MKKILIFIALTIGISNYSLAYNRNGTITINTLGGKIQYQNPYVRQNQQLKGVGNEFIGEAKIAKDGKITVFISGCKNIELGNQNDETLDKESSNKLKSLKNGDSIKIRMNRYGSCEVGDWKKN